MLFANPNILWLLLVIPPGMVGFFWWAGRKREQLMVRFIQARLLPSLVAGVSLPRRRFRQGCVVVSAACLILALARPQWGFSWQEVKQRGVDIVVAIDTSKSMLAGDITPNRLARAKMAALDLMKLAKTDRLGLVAFAGNAFLQCPLTIDDTAFRQAVDALEVNTLPQGGTAISEAIDTALTAFKEGDNHKILVLMTDGEDHDSGAVNAAARAARAGLRIYSVGIGSAEGELLRYKDSAGREDYVRDEKGNVVKSRLDERLLQEVAGATEGGMYLRLTGAKSMDSLYSEGLAKLPKSEHQEKRVKQYEERYHWPLAGALCLLLVEMLLPERKRAGQPASTGSPLPRVAAALLLLALLGPVVAVGSPSRALRDYKAGDYDKALQQYQDLLRKKGDDPRLHFNAGASAYRQGQYEEAAKQFNEALTSPDLKLQESAYYNRGNSFYHLGEKSPESQQRMENWQKALKDYELSLKLNQKDADAQFNHQFVKKKLEELKQQQQQQQQNKNQDQKQDQDKNQDQQQSQQQQQQQDQQQKQNQSEQNQQQQKQDQQSQPNQPQDKKQPEQQQQAGNKQEQDKQQQQAQNAQPQPEKPEEEKQQQQAQAAAGQMTQEQAKQLLDAQKGDEKMLTLKPDAKPQDPSRPFKDW